MSKDKRITCNSCRCSTFDNKLKVTCFGTSNGKDITIICKDCNCIDDGTNDEKEICLKDCDGEDNTIYITCTEYEEDLD